ncbi:MAG TPA: hypothetical protein VIB62_07760 [Actinomycetota bacterium]|jgi:hypothetical protein
MRTLEVVVAAVLTAMGIRSFLSWSRRPFESADRTDRLLYALYLTGRVGLWFAFAGMFWLFATVDTVDPVTGERIPAEGRAFSDAASQYRWFVLVFLVLGAFQLVAGWFLGRRRPPDG